MALHHNFRLGQKVFIIMKDGAHFTDKYGGRTSLHLVLKQRVLRWKDIRSVTIWRGKNG